MIFPSTTSAFLLLVGGTLLGLAGIDLVLPAIPALPEALRGSPERAQLVLVPASTIV